MDWDTCMEEGCGAKRPEVPGPPDHSPYICPSHRNLFEWRGMRWIRKPMLYDLHQLFFDRGTNGIPVWGNKVAGDLSAEQVLKELGKKADLKEWEVHLTGTKGQPIKATDFVRRHLKSGADLEHATIAPTKYKWQVILGGKRLGDFDDLDAALRHGIEETVKLLPDKPVFATPDGLDWSIRALIPGLNAEGHESATVFKVPA